MTTASLLAITLEIAKTIKHCVCNSFLLKGSSRGIDDVRSNRSNTIISFI